MADILSDIEASTATMRKITIRRVNRGQNPPWMIVATLRHGARVHSVGKTIDEAWGNWLTNARRISETYFSEELK